MDEKLFTLQQILAELKESDEEKDPIDEIILISSTNPWILRYRERKHIYFYSPTFQSISIEELGTIPLPPQSWTLFDFLAGSRLTVAGAVLTPIEVKYTDELLPTGVPLTSGGLVNVGATQIGTWTLGQGFNFIGNVEIVNDYPINKFSGVEATPITATSGNQTNAVATATLAAASGKTTYITGFEVTGTGATGVLAVIVTVTNLVSGTMSYIYVFVAGVTTANTSLIVEFTKAIPANAPNTTIVVSCPASGAGGTNNVVNAHGYQL